MWRFVGLCCVLLLAVLSGGGRVSARADEEPYQAVEPQPRGWPLTDAERDFVLRPEHLRRPGSEQKKHLPALWPVIPSAGHWGGTSWLDTHGKLAQHVASRPGPVDFLLVGDSITQQWGSPLDGRPMNAGWTAQFGDASVVNLGIGGDKTQNLLWRLDHGGVEGLLPRCIVLMIGNNNMFFAPETGVEPVAKGIRACVDTLRRQFPRVPVVVVKILPAHAPGNAFYENIRKTNAALDPLRLDQAASVRVLDLTSELIQPDGRLKADLYTPDNIHLSAAGYALYAARLRPVVDELLNATPR